MKKKGVILTAIIFAFIFANVILISAAPTILLHPASGSSATIIGGSGFTPGANIVIFFDGGLVAAVPSPLTSSGVGGFIAIITIPASTSVGSHTITANDGLLQSSANFNVINTTGPQGPPGPQGSQGEKGGKGDQGLQGIQGIQGEKGEVAEQTGTSALLIASMSISGISLAAAITSLVFVLKKKKLR